jgi:uncharacterized membrane protein
VSLEQTALLFHLIGAFLLVSGTVVAGVAFEAARRRAEPGEIALLLGLARTGAGMVGVGAVLVLAFGLVLVHVGHWSYRAPWVVAALVLFACALVLGAAGGRAPRRARELASRAATAGVDGPPELRALLDDGRARAANYAAAALLLAILVLMVFRPGSGPS